MGTRRKRGGGTAEQAAAGQRAPGPETPRGGTPAPGKPALQPPEGEAPPGPGTPEGDTPPVPETPDGETSDRETSAPGTAGPDKPGPEKPGPEVSESERLLFGGPLRYDTGWSQHHDAFLELNFRGMVRRLPGLLAASFRLARQADRRATHTVLAAEAVRGIAQAISLLAVNSVLSRVISGGPLQDRLRGAVPALVAMAAVMLVGALLRAASTYATGRLEPKVERVATELYLERAAAVELSAIEDHAFHKLLGTAQYGAASARRMISYGTRVVNAMISLVAAAGVLTVLRPVLLPLLATMTLPSAWSAFSPTRATIRPLAERIAMVAQDFKRWPFTARVNVAVGRSSDPLTEKRPAAAVREAGAEEVVADLPRGLDTLLARHFSGGHELSGGQWQRLGSGRPTGAVAS